MFIPITDNKESIIFENEKHAIKTAQFEGVKKARFADTKYKLAKIKAIPKDFKTLFKNIFIFSLFLLFILSANTKCNICHKCFTKFQNSNHYYYLIQNYLFLFHRQNNQLS